MKEINFNEPLHLNNSVRNVHKFLNQKIQKGMEDAKPEEILKYASKNWNIKPLQKINNIPGVVENGIFSTRKADIILLATESGVEVI